MAEQQRLTGVSFEFFFSTTVDIATAAASLVSAFAGLGFTFLTATIDRPTERQVHKGSYPQTALPEDLLLLEARFAYSGQHATVQIYPSKRSVLFSGTQIDAAVTAKVKSLLQETFPPTDSIPLNRARQHELDVLLKHLAAHDKQYSSAIERQAVRCEEIDTANESRMAMLENTYREHMRLKAPVTYWTDRQETMKKSAAWRLRWLGGGVALTVLGIGGIAMIMRAYAEDSHPPFWLLASAAVCLSLAVWVLRMLSTAYFSAMHLAEDAGFRAQVTHAYLALLSDSAAAKEDRHLVLQQLFRPVSYGLLKQDGPPLGIADAVRTLGSKT